MQKKGLFFLVCSAMVFGVFSLIPLNAHGDDDCYTSQGLILLDKSSSMTNTGASGDSLWEEAVDAIDFMTVNFENAIDFGLMVFPYPNECSPGQVVVDMAPNNSSTIQTELQDPPPESGNWTPMAQSIEAAADYQPLHVSHRPSFVLLITDGWQYCSPYEAATRFLPVGAVEDLHAMGIPVYIVGFTQSVDVLTLNRMADAGGTAHVGCDVDSEDADNPENCYFQANDYASLTAVLEQIALEVVHDRPCGTNEGECQEGVQTCRNGVWSDCVDEAGPTEEICDGLDNNCNGITDEGCDCIEGETRPCGTNEGECMEGVQVCDQDGVWSENCEGAIEPVEEICDGLDNNCNGLIDDGENLCDPGWECINGECVPTGDPNEDDEDDEEDEFGHGADSPASCGCRTLTGGTTPALHLLALLGLFGLVSLFRRRNKRSLRRS